MFIPIVAAFALISVVAAGPTTRAAQSTTAAPVTSTPVAPTTSAPPPVPTFADQYSATGFILLPYANLREPFTAFYDAKLNKSRIDYYNDTMYTYQIATSGDKIPKAGSAFKVTWSPNRQTHVPEQVCYQANATDKAPQTIQSVFPDLVNFKYAGQLNCKTNSSYPDGVPDETCDLWTFSLPKLNRTNDYFFYAIKTNDSYMPVRYDMIGYDSLFLSHYDHYEMIYTTYDAGAQNNDVFDPTRKVTNGVCIPYPEGSGLPTHHLFNPMQEFARHDESHLDAHFEHFKSTHGKTYSEEEEAQRKNQFRHNQRFINSMNRLNTGYALKINHLADKSPEERRFLYGRKKQPTEPNRGVPFDSNKYSLKDLPKSIDWRKVPGVVSQVKDQAICGSCWSFGTTGHLESMYALQTGKSVRFSEQQLVDCSWNYGNGGCDGGQDYQAYHYIIDYGLSTDEQYGTPYIGVNGKCDDGRKKTLSTLLGYANVTGIDDLKKAVAFIGPISVGIDAAHETLSFYSHGVFSDPTCGNRLQDLDHAVLAVGYGTTDSGESYWIIKNSWSTHWGDEGYVKMAMAGNMCGVATAATCAFLPVQ